MVSNAETLRLEALALPLPERADLAAELLASLEEPNDDDLGTVQALWGEEIERRAKRVLSQSASGESWDSLRRRLATNFGG